MAKFNVGDRVRHSLGFDAVITETSDVSCVAYLSGEFVTRDGLRLSGAGPNGWYAAVHRDLTLCDGNALPDPAPVEEWHGFRKGERVRSQRSDCIGAVVGGDETDVFILRDDGRTGGSPDGAWLVNAQDVVRVSDDDPKVQKTCPGEGGHACNCERCAPKKRGRRRLAPEQSEANSDPYAERPHSDHSDPHRMNSAPAPMDPDGRDVFGLGERIAASRKAQAREALDRPLRTGPLKNRDRYGQLLSLRGWETED